jgi:hypothetical protein
MINLEPEFIKRDRRVGCSPMTPERDRVVKISSNRGLGGEDHITNPYFLHNFRLVKIMLQNFMKKA